MIGSLAVTLASGRSARAALRWSALALTILLFLLSFRRFGSALGVWRSVSKPRRRPMMRSVGCWTLRLAGLVIAMSWLGACATADSEPPLRAACPPTVDYEPVLLARAADEIEALPPDPAVVTLLADHAVMREQAPGFR